MLILIVLLYSCSIEKQEADMETSNDTGLYYGIEPPGLTAKALERSDKGWEFGSFHGSSQNEFYLISTSELPLQHLVKSYRLENWTWKQYEFYATGSDTLYSKDKFIERTDSGWSEIKSLGAPFDTIPIMRLTASTNTGRPDGRRGTLPGKRPS